ncbi:MAG: UvrD-helicase domain-containing protein [Proteobacteria bacterium]|nr:UvrD-helicase domain-containing protein [Pseudomonadota bacterium]
MTESNRALPHILIVKSSAGAGKTYNLALRYLQLLLLDKIADLPIKTHISNIVAITFTNKAAHEMRSRIIEWMKRIILDLPFENSSDRPVDEILKNMSGVSGNGTRDLKSLEDSIRETIEINFEALIKNFYDFNVSTIDSFVNLTLKASAFKLNLMPDFDISLDSAVYIDIVLQECLQKILEDNAVRERFDRFLRNYIELEGENVTWIPKDFLRDIISGFWREEAKENASFIYKANISHIEHIKNRIEEEVSGLASYLKATEGMKPDKRFINALEQFSISKKSEIKLSNYFLRQALGASLNKGSAQPDREHEDLWKDILLSLSMFFEAVSESKFSSYVDIYLLFKKVLSKEITHDKSLVLIEQLNTLLQQILDKEHFIPEIYYALAERYSHFLIDEFQDTNHLQWKNVEILAEEALSRGGTLFLVGDKKQAIYRWRGGKSELVDEVALKYSAYPVYEFRLTENYRSDEYIVKFNNIVFDSANLRSLIESAALEYSAENMMKVMETYTDAAQRFISSKADKGYIRIERIVEQTDVQEQESVNDNFSSLSKDEKNEIIEDRFRQLIRRIKDNGIFQEKDIAVLVRRKEEARFIVRTLLENGFSVESEFTVNVKNNPLIKEMINFLDFINTPDNDLAFAGFLTGSIFQNRISLPEGGIIQWIERIRITGNPGYLYEAFKQVYQAIWNEYFEYFFKRAGYLPLYELVVLFMKKWRILIDYPDDAPYFMHVCELIKAREALEGNNLNKFLQFWNGNTSIFFRDSQEVEKPFLLNTFEGTNAVKVMTIHKAKGLQFPVVILPFFKLNAFGVSDSRDKTKYFVREKEDMHLLYIKKDFTKYSQKLKDIYQEKEAEYLLDELNNMYVACTRAQKELYIFLGDSKRQKNYLIDYFFNVEDLKTYVNGDVIEMGRQTDTVPASDKDQGAISEINSDASEPLFHDLGDDIKWMEKIGTKLEAAPGFFKEQLFAKKKGDIIHYILSLIIRLPDQCEEFLNTCISSGIARYTFHPYADEIKKMIFNIFLNPEFKRFFQPEEDTLVYTEKEIIDSRGNTYKVDRITITDDCIEIVDFKTGETRSEEHARQIMQYAGLIETIHPDKAIKKYILYLDEGKIQEI